MTEEGPDRCFICLATDGELTPFSKNGVAESLISPCYCSLRAHKSCLVDWVVNSAGDTLTEFQPYSRNHDTLFGYRLGDGGGVGIRPIRKLLSSEKVKCPQCGHRITLMMKPSSILSLNYFIRTNASTLGKTLLVTAGTSVVAGAVLVSVVSVLASCGLKMLKAIAPDSVLIDILGVSGYYRNFDSALRNGKISMSQMSVLAQFPIYLYAIRSPNKFAYFYTNIYPFNFIQHLLRWDISTFTGPKTFLFWFEALRSCYDGFFALTFNRIYYRWINKHRAFYSQDITGMELDETQTDIETLESLESERLAAESKENYTFFQKLYYWVFPKYSELERALRQKLRSRELYLVLKNDYTKPFFKTKGLKLLTTAMWPFLGGFVGSLLIESSSLRRLVYKIASTPDESKFIFNCIGCCAVVVLKDIMNLIIASQEIDRFENMDIVHRGTVEFDQVRESELEELRNRALEIAAADGDNGANQNADGDGDNAGDNLMLPGGFIDVEGLAGIARELDAHFR